MRHTGHWQRVIVLAMTFGAACEDGAGLGEACGDTGHATTNCAKGLFCARESGQTTGICKTPAKENEPCLGQTSASCQAGLVCNLALSPPTCLRPAGQGGACTQNAECESGLICFAMGGVGTCEAPRTTGGECFQNDQCAMGLTCLPDASATLGGRCGARVGDGQSCNDDGDCVDPLLCNGGYDPPRCAGVGPLGAPCSGTNQCTSNNCDFVNRVCIPI